MSVRRGGGTGRRTGLKIPWPSGRAGSIPAPGTPSLSVQVSLLLVTLVGAGLRWLWLEQTDHNGERFLQASLSGCDCPTLTESEPSLTRV